MDIPHGGADLPAHLIISITANPSTGAVKFVSFRLPGAADRGKLFAIGFADSEKDPAGQWTLKMVPAATRVLEVRDCGETCLVTLPGGLAPSETGEAGLDVVKTMLSHRFLLMSYFRGGERITAAAPLYVFQEKYSAVIGGTGR